MTTWVLFAGLPGTGKSTLARALAQRLGAAVLDKDRVRAALFPGGWTDYTDEQAQLCMRAMLEAALYLTRRGANYVFFDGRTFSQQVHVEDVLLAAEQAGARWRIVHLVCDDAVASERLAKGDPSNPAQNRDPALYHRLKHHFQPIRHANLQLDSSLGTVLLLSEVESYVVGSEQPARRRESR